MRVSELLEAASLLVPEAVAGENDLTVNDVWELLAHDDWETALGLLEDVSGAPAPPLPFWEALAGAAEELRLERSATWCHWRCSELRNGVVRAELTLRPAGEGRRRTPVPGPGVLRPLWDTGRRAPDGGRSVSIGALWVENRPYLELGGQATVRIVPLTPAHWEHLRAGRHITLHEDRTMAGTATVLEVRPPATATASPDSGDVSAPAGRPPRPRRAVRGRSPSR